MTEEPGEKSPVSSSLVEGGEDSPQASEDRMLSSKVSSNLTEKNL